VCVRGRGPASGSSPASSGSCVIFSPGRSRTIQLFIVPSEAPEPADSGPTIVYSLKPNKRRREVRDLGTPFRRVIQPSAEVQRPTIGNKRVLRAAGLEWLHETLFVPSIVNGRSTAKLTGASANVFGYWRQFGKIRKGDAAGHQASDWPWSLDELATREIVWHMTQELPPEAGSRARWDTLGEGRKRQELIVEAHPELVAELLALGK